MLIDCLPTFLHIEKIKKKRGEEIQHNIKNIYMYTDAYFFALLGIVVQSL